MQEETNTYLYNLEQDSWNDLHVYHMENAAAWRMVAIIALMSLVIVSCYAMYLVNQDKHKTLIFAKDDLGNITTLGLAYKTFNVDNKMVAHQLVNFIVALREVPTDVALKRRNIDIVHKMITEKLRPYVDKMLISEYSHAVNTPVIVDVSEVKPLPGGHSWEINWRETKQLYNENSNNGNSENAKSSNENNTSDYTSNENSPNISYWSSIITFVRQDDVSPQVQIVNPLGLMVDYVHPTENLQFQSST